MNKNSVFDCSILPLDTLQDQFGNMVAVQGNQNINFPIERVYYMYGMPEGVSRGGHAHTDLYQLIVATGGSFDVLLDDGKNKKVVRLNQPNQGLFVVPGIWRDLYDFSAGAVCLVFASLTYKNNVSIRHYDEFRKFKGLEN
ncbi:sugar 3,4-ketoisomerase [Autumnicola edwardsiae]|uniref:FdtA/QdtA family cupin domain-containing protein n=1 Tax=Autumnicola edwardsiae TaxID=3075594 RepID=A0ABU3CTH0_9FLAO|nr:FdtA/QdtA family cupin domain-containing protein [Zunongwangia sp. F297]MDT0649657.1 FdtA/QdtA family cupin domain-containing protein [Zunongwangia sp. F297]